MVDKAAEDNYVYNGRWRSSADLYSCGQSLIEDLLCVIDSPNHQVLNSSVFLTHGLYVW